MDEDNEDQLAIAKIAKEDGKILDEALTEAIQMLIDNAWDSYLAGHVGTAKKRSDKAKALMTLMPDSSISHTAMPNFDGLLD